MRRRITLLAAFAALAACAQNDQSLPVEPEPNAPVTGAMGASATTVSTPAGVSVTVPAGALPVGTKITVAHLDASTATDLPAVGDAYLVGFDEVPADDPTVSFSFTVNEETTAGELVGMVPLVLRVGNPGASSFAHPAASRYPSFSTAGETSALEKFEELKSTGIFAGLDGSASLKDEVMMRGHAADIIARLAKLDVSLPPAPPVFSDVPEDVWYHDPFIDPAVRDALVDAAFMMTFRSPSDQPSWSHLPPVIELPQFIDPSVAERFRAALASIGAVYLIVDVKSDFLAAREIVPFPSNDTDAFPLIPAGSSSATFELACTGISWPGADGVPHCSENTVDVRVGAELLRRYPASLVVPNYLLGQVTIGADGSATGRVEYDAFLRSALSSGITGVGANGAFDLAGTWSASGDTITVGGHDFPYATPDAKTLILSVSDSVQIENTDGTKSWQPIQVDVKLTRK